MGQGRQAVVAEAMEVNGAKADMDAVAVVDTTTEIHRKKADGVQRGLQTISQLMQQTKRAVHSEQEPTVVTLWHTLSRS